MSLSSCIKFHSEECPHLRDCTTTDQKTVYSLEENLFTSRAVRRARYLSDTAAVNQDMEWLVRHALDKLHLKFPPRVDQVIPLVQENICQEVLADAARAYLLKEKIKQQRSTLVKRDHRYLVQREPFVARSWEEMRAGECCLVLADSLCSNKPIEQMKEYLSNKGAFPLAICSLVERRPEMKNPSIYPEIITVVSVYEELPIFSLEWLSQYSILKKSEKGLKGLIIDKSTAVF